MTKINYKKHILFKVQKYAFKYKINVFNISKRFNEGKWLTHECEPPKS